MKSKTYLTIVLLFLTLNSFVYSQNIKEDHQLTKTERTELQEAFYKNLGNHPLINKKDVQAIRFYFLDNLKFYRKELHKMAHSHEGGISKNKIKTLFPQLVELLIRNFESQRTPFRVPLLDNKGNNSNEKGPGQPCQNMGFDNCNFFAWNLTQGSVNNTPYGFINPITTVNWGNGSAIGFPGSNGPGPDQHYIVNAGVDPNVPIQMVNPQYGGTCSAVLGDGNSVGSRASRISQTFLVDSNNANFSYSYAAVLEDPSGHTLGEKPYFQARVYDSAGNSIVCGEFESTAGDGSLGWMNTGMVQYRDWSTVIVPLQAYLGQNVTVEFTVGDCSLSGHYGYAYVESSCIPLEIVPSDTVVCGAPVTLNAPSPFNGTYLWSTGATTSSITTSTPGLYTVDLITAPGCFITLDVIIVADSTSPTALFVADTVCQGAITSFSDFSTTPTGSISSWNWDFNNDGIIDDISQNPNYTFPSIGVYPVTLSVGGGNCGHDTTINVVVVDGPIADFIFSTVCLGDATNFTDLSNPNGGVISSWNWDFDNDGIFDSNGQNPTNIYTTTGTFTAELFVSTSSGCSDSVSMQILVNPLPIANFSAISVCEGIATLFNDLSVTNNGLIVDWLWDFGDGVGSSQVQNPSYTYPSAGNYNTLLTVISDSGCSNSVSIPLIVYPNPTANFSPTEVCLDDPTQFIDLSTVYNTGTPNTITQWSWTFNGLGNANIQHPTFVFSQDGLVPTILIITTNNGCIDSVTLDVMVNPKPVVMFGKDTAACAPVCFTFENSSSISSGTIASYQWDFGDESGGGNQNPTHCYQNYSRVASKSFDVGLVVTSDNGCTEELTIQNMVTVYPIPLAAFEIEPEVTDVYNREVSFYDASEIASSWLWELGDGSNSIVQNPVHQYPDSGSYFVQLYIENTFGCKDTTAREIRIKPAYAIWIPNVFTPNGDGMNEGFFIDGFGIQEVELRIFNRWGNKIFHGSGESSDVVWNGEFNGSVVQTDVYVYKAKVKDVLNEYHDFVGKVTIIK